MTYKEIINRFRTITENHLMLEDFGYGDRGEAVGGAGALLRVGQEGLAGGSRLRTTVLGGEIHSRVEEIQ